MGWLRGLAGQEQRHEGWGGTLVMFIAMYLVGVRKRRKARLGAATWIYNEFSCLARVRIRKAKVPGSKGWGMVAVKGKGRHFGHVYSKVSSWSPKEKKS
jgi:hypothetical protein